MGNQSRVSRGTGTFFLGALISAFLAVSISADAGEKQVIEEVEPATFLDHVKPVIDIRPRYELGDQDGRATSHAFTLRGRLGLMIDNYHGFSALAEYEGTVTPDRTSYQAASVHGTGQNKTIIADPESHELNRLWIGYELSPVEAKVGRQRILLDNQRFIGNVGWRQNEQTYDAARLTAGLTEKLELTYGYFYQVNRIFGSQTPQLPGQRDFEGNSHVVNLRYAYDERRALTAYAYILDLGNDGGDAASNASFGLIASGSYEAGPDWLFDGRAEYAYQVDAFNNPQNYGAHYGHLSFKGTLRKSCWFETGLEYLGSDSDVGFQFPLGTNHKFNGYADVYLRTPPDGLTDIYLTAGTKLPYGFKLSATYHWFGNDRFNFSNGHEIDAVLTKPLGKHVVFLAKFANYFAQDFGVDTLRVTAQFDIKF